MVPFPAVWSAADAARLATIHPDAVVVLDANRRPTAVIPTADVDPGHEFPVHARAALVTGPNAEVRAVLAAAGIAVLDHWPPESRPAGAENRFRMEVVFDAMATDTGPAIVGFGDDELAVRPLDGVHPADALQGFEAALSWWAIGVLATGRILAPADQRAAITVVTAVTRGNEEVGWIERPDGTRTRDLGPSKGRVPDAIRRALGLPTPPPPEPTDALYAAWWLSALAAERVTSWAAATQLHPAAQTFATEGTLLHPDQLVDAARALGRVVGWDDIRGAVVDGRMPGSGIAPAIAAWMDAGMFSRELLAAAGDVDQLIAAVEQRCSRDVSGRARRAVARLPVQFAA